MEVHILASGSDGNCAIVRHEDTAVMIDAGLTGKRVSQLMEVHGIDASEIKALFITHEHADHIKCAGVVARKFKCPIICNDPTFAACGDMGKVEHQTIRMFQPMTVGTITLTPLPTSHDAKYPCCYTFEAGGMRGTIATDTGYYTHEVKQALKDSAIAVMESNYDKRMLDEGPYSDWLKRRINGDLGHVSNVLCGRTVGDIFTPDKKIFLAHLSRTNNIPDLAKETVSKLAGISKYRVDCLDNLEDTRILKC